MFDVTVFDALLALVGDNERVLKGSEAKEEYSHDELGGTKSEPDYVVVAKSAEEISKIMTYAYEKEVPVTVRGSGTGLVGACVPVCNGILIDMSALNKILELDEENLTVTVEPGVLLMDLAKFAEENDLMYPPDPGEKTATIGGNISTNAGGMRAVKYGVTRDYVRALEVVLPSGKIVNFGGKIVKNSSGYALKDLMVGSEGTLGIITKAVLKLIPLPKKTISLLIPFPSLEGAIGTVPKIIKAKCVPTAIEFMQREVIYDAESYLGTKFPDASGDAYLLLKFDGNSKEEIENSYSAAAEICLAEGAIDIFISDTEERDETIWKARGAFLEAIKNSTSDMDEVDVVVPRNRVNEMVEFSHELSAKVGARIKSFGHAGDGNLHIYVLKDDLGEGDWQEKLSKAMDEMYAKARELQGEVSGEHGIGFAKKEFLHRSLDPESIELMRGIKAVFDPKNLLNPNKIF